MQVAIGPCCPDGEKKSNEPVILGQSCPKHRLSDATAPPCTKGHETFTKLPFSISVSGKRAGYCW